MDAASAFADLMMGDIVPSLAGAAGCTIGIPGKKNLMEKVYPPLSNVPDNVVSGIDPKDLPCGKGDGKKE
jgi:hypothetical protein